MASPAGNDGACLLCGQTLRRAAALPLGSLPACNDFSGSDGATHALSAAECECCNLVQLLDRAPPAFVRPRHAWIRYNEPTGHLADLGDRLRARAPSARPVALGVGPFDGPLLDVIRPWCDSARALDLTAELPRQEGRHSYLESWQAALRTAPLARVAARQGRADLVACRFLLEHSHDPLDSLRALGALLKPDGALLVEVPDSGKFLAAGDYSFFWEEHLCYFTEATLRRLAARAGYAVEAVLRYPGALEDALVCILRPGAPAAPAPAALGPSALFAGLRAGLAPLRLRYRQALAEARRGGRRVALFGAGHQAVMFINALGLPDLIDCVIDDAPDKLGHTMPGTPIPIVPSGVLHGADAPALCLLALAPPGAAKIRALHAAYLAAGGRMYSIFPGAGPTLIDCPS